jgi:hypothetical protein
MCEVQYFKNGIRVDSEMVPLETVGSYCKDWESRGKSYTTKVQCFN